MSGRGTADAYIGPKTDLMMGSTMVQVVQWLNSCAQNYRCKCIYITTVIMFIITPSLRS